MPIRCKCIEPAAPGKANVDSFTGRVAQCNRGREKRDGAQERDQHANPRDKTELADAAEFGWQESEETRSDSKRRNQNRAPGSLCRFAKRRRRVAERVA